jgi:hypothetical protein
MLKTEGSTRNDDAEVFERCSEITLASRQYGLGKQPKGVLEAFVFLGEVETLLCRLTCGGCDCGNVAAFGKDADYPAPWGCIR